MIGIDGAQSFIPARGIFTKRFESIITLLIYCYQKMLQNNEEIDNSNEEHIRDVLLEEYVKKYQNDFDLGYIFFSSETYQIRARKVVGRADIQATFIIGGVVHYDNYFIIECKRLKNKMKNDAYINEGLYRFASNVYSPDRPLAGMIGFVEQSSISIDDIINDLNIRLSNANCTVKTLNYLKFKNIDPNFSYSYESIHERNNNDSVHIYHLMFDLSNVIKQVVTAKK